MKLSTDARSNYPSVPELSIGALEVGFRRVTGWSDRGGEDDCHSSHWLPPASCRVMHWEKGIAAMKKEDPVWGDGWSNGDLTLIKRVRKISRSR